MSRPVIAAGAVGLILVLTGVAYFITTSSLERRIRRDISERVANAQDLLLREAELEGLGLGKRAEALAAESRFVEALRAVDGPDARLAVQVFKDYRGSLGVNEPRPAILALTDDKGQVVALLSGDKEVASPIADAYFRDGELKYPALALALGEKRYRLTDVWLYQDQAPMRVSVAPIVDIDFGELLGAVIMAYGITAAHADRASRLLGAEVAYFYGDSVHASSFGGGRGEVSAADLAGPLFEGGLAKEALGSEKGIASLVNVDIAGEEYIATAGRISLKSNTLPADYPAPLSGAMVGMSVDDALAVVKPVKLAILLVGLGAIVVALIAMFIAVKQILTPVDSIELGLAEMLNGDLDVTFEPVGSDLDGLSNSLNVLLARLLGRPEPGEEEYDENGNLIQPSSSIRFAQTGLSPKDADALELAEEPEDEYYARLFGEYVAALERAGTSISGLTQDTFINKLRLNESRLKEKYESSSVRFKVIEQDGKVTLKPVPIM